MQRSDATTCCKYRALTARSAAARVAWCVSLRKAPLAHCCEECAQWDSRGGKYLHPEPRCRDYTEASPTKEPDMSFRTACCFSIHTTETITVKTGTTTRSKNHEGQTDDNSNTAATITTPKNNNHYHSSNPQTLNHKIIIVQTMIIHTSNHSNNVDGNNCNTNSNSKNHNRDNRRTRRTIRVVITMVRTNLSS